MEHDALGYTNACFVGGACCSDQHHCSVHHLLWWDAIVPMSCILIAVQQAIRMRDTSRAVAVAVERPMADAQVRIPNA